MRELWTAGWMHNRVRMVTASFLTKHLPNDLLHAPWEAPAAALDAASPYSRWRQ